jgi:DNA-binding transcriptional ArsR family regulator
MARKDKPDLQALLTALKHEMRRRILRVMADGEPISPCELAKRLDESVSNVSYHVRVLARYMVVESVEDRQVRGATQHLYRFGLGAEWARKVLEEFEEDGPGERDEP